MNSRVREITILLNPFLSFERQRDRNATLRTVGGVPLIF